MSHGGQRPKVNDRKHQWADQPVETLAEARLRAHRLLPRRVLASGHCSTSHFSLTHTHSISVIASAGMGPIEAKPETMHKS